MPSQTNPSSQDWYFHLRDLVPLLGIMEDKYLGLGSYRDDNSLKLWYDGALISALTPFHVGIASVFFIPPSSY